jgi:hypothetical protein
LLERPVMRPAAASKVAVLVALLTVGVTPLASAQPRRPVSAAQAAAIAGQAGAWDAYAWMTAAQAQQYATRMPPAQLEQAREQYFTNGAAVMSVPTSGPGAEYFSNGAEMLATPATSWVEGPLAAPEAPAASASATAATTPPAPSTSASAPPAPSTSASAPPVPSTSASAPSAPSTGAPDSSGAAPAPASPEGATAEADAGSAAPHATATASPEAAAPELPLATGAPPPPLPPGVTMMQGSSPVREPASSGVAAPHAARAAVHAQKSSWLAPVAGGFVAFAFLTLFAERLLRRRDRRA